MEAREASRRKKILVVEDTDLVRHAMVRCLQQLGYVVTEACDGADGLAMLQRELPDLVLCDLRMPRMDGLQLLAAVRTDFPDLPFLVVSGAGLVGDAIGALRLGAWDYVEKPIIEIAVLEHAVRRALERAELIEENRRYRTHLERVNRELRASLQLLSDDEDAGREIQTRMLPRNHQRFGPFEFSRVVVPSAFLSGDFIDAFAIDDRRWAFYLADVAGHGVSSALVTVLLRSFVQRQASEHARTRDGMILSPARLLERLNEEMSRDDLDKHLTIFYGVIDSVENTLICANAGHFPWPLLHDGKSTVELEQPSLPVGVMPGTRYTEQRIPLPDDMVLAIFSDGLLEVLPHEALDEKRAFLRQLFGRRSVTVEQVRKDLELDARRPLPDDVAILLITRGGSPS